MVSNPLSDAAEGSAVAEYGGFKFGKLTMRDIASHQATAYAETLRVWSMVPNAGAAPDPPSYFAMYSWYRTAAGILAAVVAAGQKFDPMFSEAAVDEFDQCDLPGLAEKIINSAYRRFLKESRAEGNASGASDQNAPAPTTPTTSANA